jgi:hypothetical protein
VSRSRWSLAAGVPSGRRRTLLDAALDAAELVVFEENEVALPMSDQGTLLLREIEKGRSSASVNE